MKKKDLIVGVIFIFVVGTCLHFTYAWSSRNIVVGLFSAINESVWEHTKMVILPTCLYYLYYYLKNKKSVNKDYLFSSMIVNLLVAIITMPFMFYFYSGAFGVELLIVDIIIFLISILLGTYYGNKYYLSKKKLPWIVALIIIVIIYTIFTLYQPHIPIFIAK